jgi:hypothetical protein
VEIKLGVGMFNRDKNKFKLCIAWAFGLFFILTSPGSADDQQFMSVLGVTPEGETCMMGGALRNVIAEPDVLVEFMQHKQIYTLINLGDTRGEVMAIGAPETPEQSGDCEQSHIQELTLSPDQLGLLQIAVKGSVANAKNRIPRSLKRIDLQSKAHRELVKNYLIKAGLENPDVRLRQVIETDIDGDGKPETIINALNSAYGNMAKGEYSLVLLVRGELDNPQIIDVHKEITMDDAAEPSMIVAQTIVSALDIESDGKMELVLFGAFAFGEGWQVLRVRAKNTEQILFCGCG